MTAAGLKTPPESWIKAFAARLADSNFDDVPKLLSAIHSLHITEKGEPVWRELERIANDPKQITEARIYALSLRPGTELQLSDEMFEILLSHLSGDAEVDLRSAAADVLSRSKLSSERLASIAGVIEAAGPLEIERLVSAFAQSDDDATGRALLTGVAKAPGASAVRPEVLTSSLARCSEDVRRAAAELLASRTKTTAEQAQQLEKLIQSLPKGDVRRGQAVFNSSKAACTSCHAIGYLGGKLGPDLTKIGEVRSERDLLEAIVFPSASFVRSYEPLAVLKSDGTIVSGLVRKDAPDEVVLAISATEERRVPRGEIDEVHAGTTSIMPAGLDQQLTSEQLADLVAFLKACR
jgi:putative heme-binding domain-containing protein